jgi:hypothetical protein
MDYSQVCQGWIYCITNKVNGKRYIGQTINYRRRKYEHFVLDETCNILGRAFAKYGKENFKMEILLTFRAVNDKVRKQLLDYFERWYILKFGTYQKEYNATLGGEGSLGFKHTDETKNKLSNIRKADSKIGQITSKPVLLYDLNGDFVREYKSISEAVRAIGRNADCYSDIWQALQNPKKKVHGYLWRYKETNFFPLFIEPYVWPTSKPVYHYSKDGVFLKAYRSIQDAASELNIKIKKIQSSILKTRDKPRTDDWSYIPPAA